MNAMAVCAMKGSEPVQARARPERCGKAVLRARLCGDDRRRHRRRAARVEACHLRHFGGKSDILVEICEQAIRFSIDLAERVARDKGAPAQKLRRLARDFTAIVIDNQDDLAIASREMKFLPRKRILRMQERFDRILGGVLAQGVARGQFDIPDPDLTGLAISGMIIGIYRWYPSAAGCRRRRSPRAWPQPPRA
jgi:AcrR family transcriptional regulator